MSGCNNKAGNVGKTKKQNNQMTAQCVHRTGETMIHQWVSLCSLPQHNWEPKYRDGQLNLTPSGCKNMESSFQFQAVII